MRHPGSVFVVSVFAAWFALAIPVVRVWADPQADEDEYEFFEKKIRPVLAENCYLCHGSQTEPMAGLRLDSRAGLLQGGTRGPAVVPFDPDKSLLIEAISYKNPDLNMPPTGRLSEEQISDFIAWVEMGAPDPRTETAPTSPVIQNEGVDYEQGRQFWSFRPIQSRPLPSVQRKEWNSSPIDSFILAKLEEKGLAPAPPADRRTWIRRVTFDLVGLPPTADEIDAYIKDESPKAHEKVVERLLASPHYGERWARHWLDVVRFAETDGHEFDTNKLDAWRYRDYVIRAFNRDLPYDVFVREHIAGDLLGRRRLLEDGSAHQSPLATGFYWFGEILNSPVDSIKSRADQVDNQIDVISKAFLGLTVACARCHDHKFDPIAMKDYYALAGVLHSTEVSEALMDSPARAAEIGSVRRKIQQINRRMERELQPAGVKLAARLPDYLTAAAEVVLSKESESEPSVDDVDDADNVAAAQNLDPATLLAWVKRVCLAGEARDDIFYPFAAVLKRLADGGKNSFSDAWKDVLTELSKGERRALPVFSDQTKEEAAALVFDDFEKKDFTGWRVEGRAFGEAPAQTPAPHQALRGYVGGGVAGSFRAGSEKFVGSLTSRKFRMPKLYVHVRIAGTAENRKLQENAKLRFTIVASDYKSQHIMPEGGDRFRWKTVRMTKEIGRICYLEIVDRSRKGHIAVDKIIFSDSEKPPEEALAPNSQVLALLESEPSRIKSLDSLASAYQEMFRRDLEQARTSGDPANQIAALLPTGRLEDAAGVLSPGARKKIGKLRRKRAALEETIPESRFGMVSKDYQPHNVRVHLRGSHKNLGEEVPRGFLRVVAGEDAGAPEGGSGRRHFARWVGSPENPLTARVMVNRVWKHHFGQGLVRTVDNFGEMGERPTHPALLDFLASRFIESGWSVKALHRMILLSSAYRQSSRSDEGAAQTDPENRLLHHMSVRRLEAEAIRDSALAVAGTLKRKMFGPSVPPHISQYQDGRGKPKSGALDGEGRRSIYIQVRRNFITPLFLAFDYPLPISTMGRRSVSTVPSQALIMMNNEFVTEEARRWAQRVLSAEDDAKRRVESMYLAAFGRAPEKWEVTEVLGFLERQRAGYGEGQKSLGSAELEERVWADLGHVLLNSTEFIYVR